MSFVEFIVFNAALVGITALTVDVMLPALPRIGDGLGLADPNERQFVVFVYIWGFAAGQLLFGPLSDSFGRRPVIIGGLICYVAAALLCTIAPTFGFLLAGRVAQGFAAASARVVSLAIIRDCYAGRDMARVMSFVMMVFMIVPIVAPAIGQGILLVTPSWRWIFLFLAIMASALGGWAATRLKETIAEEDRTPFRIKTIAHGLKLVLTNKNAVVYTVGLSFIFGCVLGYVGACEQILVGIYGLGELFPLAFAAAAATMSASSLLNSRLVQRYGMRRLSRTAVACMAAICFVMLIAGAPTHPPLYVFMGFLASYMFFIGFVMPNFNALAMEELGHVAGLAASVIGFVSTAAAAVFGAMMAQSFDGTVRPMIFGFSALTAATGVTLLLFDRSPAGPENAPGAAAESN